MTTMGSDSTQHVFQRALGLWYRDWADKIFHCRKFLQKVKSTGTITIINKGVANGDGFNR